MKTLIGTAALGATLVLGTAGPAPAQGNEPAKSTMATTRCPGGYVFTAAGGSGESGCATPRGGNGVIFLSTKVTGEPKGALQPSHIHKGKCGSNGVFIYTLSNVVNGSSATTIPMEKWSTFNHGGYYINIHASPKDLPNVVSCADITAVGRGTM
jgi:hypothetical protein